MKNADVPLAPEQLQADELCKRAMRSMLRVGAFKDLSEQDRAHPEIQRRIWNALPEMDEAIFGMSDRLTHLTPE